MDIISKIKEKIKQLKLDLTGKIVLTEAATGPYAITPIIAALGGAKVFAFTKDTKFGTVEEVIGQIEKLRKQTNNNLDIEIITELRSEIINEADIITNSGHLRPLNSLKLCHAKSGVVIPLMYDSWELRSTDIDLKFCQMHNILVAGTNESHPDIDIYGYLGDMCMKLIFDSANCLNNSTFLLISNNDFGPCIASKIAPLIEKLGIIDCINRKSKYLLSENIDWIGTFPFIQIPDKYYHSDAIILATYPFDQTWVGNKAEIPIQAIQSQFSSPFILRFSGDINTKDLDSANISYYPSVNYSGHMGVLPSEIGYEPVIRLQTAGLKVGQLLNQKELYSPYIKLIDNY